jgi:hypothetical protein
MPEVNHVIQILDEERRAKWKLAVDEDSKILKAHLSALSFQVIDFEDGLKDDQLHQVLIRRGVDFLVTCNGEEFIGYVESPVPSKKQYHVLWVNKGLLADPERAAKGIETAIMYDPRVQKGAPQAYVKITAKYIMDRGKLRKQAQQRQKK